MKADLREVRNAPDRATAEASIAAFVDFPAEHWDHLKTSNPTTVLRKSSGGMQRSLKPNWEWNRMSVTLSIALFFMMWWIVLFVILPFGIKQSQEEAGNVVPGTAESAPDQPFLWRVIVLTTVVTCILFGAYSWVRASDFSLDDIPFFVPPSLSSGKH